MDPRPRILVVDDNPPNRAVTTATFEDEDYDVVSVDNGEAAIRAFESAPPSCVVLDVRMSEMDGFEVCRRLRELPGGRDVSIVFLTALRPADALARALQAGGDDLVHKPVAPWELVVRVNAALKVRAIKAAESAQSLRNGNSRQQSFRINPQSR